SVPQRNRDLAPAYVECDIDSSESKTFQAAPEASDFQWRDQPELPQGVLLAQNRSLTIFPAAAATSKSAVNPATGRRSSGRKAIATSRPASSIANSSDIDSDDEISVAAATSTSTRIAKGVALPRLSAMERAEFKKPPPKSSKSPTDSSLSSIDANTSRDSSIEYETPGTTPATSVRAGPSTSKRKRSTLGKVVKIEDSEDEEDDDFLLATRLQEEEYTKEGAQQPAKKRTKLAIDDSEDDFSMLSDAESLSSLDSMPLIAKSKQAVKKKTPVKTESSRSNKKTPTRTASSTARNSIGKSLKKPILDDSDESDLEKASIAETEDFVVSDSEEAVSTVDGVSDTESDVPLAITSRPKTVAAASRLASRARGRGSAARGRRHGRVSAAAARATAGEIEDIVNGEILSRKNKERKKLEKSHPELKTMWKDLEQIPVIKPVQAAQPASINRRLKPFQLEGLDWMVKQEQTQYKGGLLGDEMGMGKTIQAVSLIMSDYPQKEPTLVLVPPVALMQWDAEITEYTDGKLNVLVYHGSNTKCKKMKVKDLKKFDVIMMSYNSLESMHRKQLKGHGRGEDIVRADSPIHAIHFHRIILDEAHSIKARQTGVANACFALKGTYKWCLSGTPVQNRIGEFFSLLRFLEVRPFTDYFCKECPCSIMQWEKDENHNCVKCKCRMMSHVSVFNQELLNPLTEADDASVRKAAMAKLHMITARIMLRRMKRDHTASMELPPKEVIIHNEFFGEIERDFSSSIMSNTTRQFDTYVAKGVMLNNYANIFGLIMQMRQVSNHPDLLLKRHAQEGQNVLVCNICDEVAEDAVRSQCKHDFCRACVKSYVQSVTDDGGDADCPRCHIALAIDFDQPEIIQDEDVVKKSSIINRIKMEDWTSSTKIEMLIYDLYKLRSKKQTLKSIVFSQFTSMLQLIEWRLRRAGFNTVMLDGSMTPTQRQKSIDHFMNTPDCEIFLVSLKAGGVALNLTEASRVFIVDPWWNPAAEWQSADRCHRIGQRRPCAITRLVIEDSVESRIVMLQEKKANMINSTINNDQGAMEKLTPEDMQFLFRGN
ncbi:DNA repair protein RAD16, partial [Pseudocercospora fuligena]